MKTFLLGLFVVALGAALVAPAFASEQWDPYLHGTSIGLAAGALPPPGLYFIHSSYFAPSLHSSGGLFGAPNGTENRNFKLFVYVDIPVLMWVPGWKFLGADYAMAIAQPINYTNLRIQEGTSKQYLTGAVWGNFNTVLVPYELSWKLPCDLYIKTGLSVNLNDATNNPATADTLGPGVFATAGNGYYWVSPTLGLSWLHDGWNISVFSNYAFPFEDSGTGYHSGQQLAIDYTVTKTFGKWTFGVGASEETQITTDSVHGTNIPDSKANLWSIGPVVGYNFGPCSLMFTYGFPVYTNNDLAGEWFNVRFVVPLGM